MILLPPPTDGALMVIVPVLPRRSNELLATTAAPVKVNPLRATAVKVEALVIARVVVEDCPERIAIGLPTLPPASRRRLDRRQVPALRE
jgi:hypothetical protein